MRVAARTGDTSAHRASPKNYSLRVTRCLSNLSFFLPAGEEGSARTGHTNVNKKGRHEARRGLSPRGFRRLEPRALSPAHGRSAQTCSTGRGGTVYTRVYPGRCTRREVYPGMYTLVGREAYIPGG